MKKAKRILSLFIAMLLIFPAGLSLPTFAADVTDAMIAIESNFSAYKIGSTQNVSDDGYIGIPVSISTYFDKGNFTIKAGYNGTPVIVYVVNTNVERIGTESDKVIIDSMLKRGYVVTVVDYKNNPLATGQALDWSIQGIRIDISNKKYFTDSVFPSGTYIDNHVVPAGYDVSLNNLYWEMDKHASNGTFDYIVNNWNTDFRGIKADSFVKWVRPDGTRKKTSENAVWYSEPNKNAIDTNGQYTLVKYTVAESITDIVKPDGSPIELNQYMNIIYPVKPEKEVPVYCMALSTEYLAKSPQTADRPHLNGAMFRGYAGVTYDYAFVPMARDDAYKVYNGTNLGAVSGDSDNYGVHMYDDKRVTTAAMRYIRYLALSQPETFKLDTDHIGIVGNSKGGAFSFLGEKIVQAPLVENPEDYSSLEQLETAIDTKLNSIMSRRVHDGHDNETRFQVGDTASYTKDGITIDGGEKQPWLTYNGKEIKSGAQLIFASNGVCGEEITEGHAPQIVMCHENDPWHYYGPLNEFANICYSLNIPMLQFEVPLDHTIAYGPDNNYNVDTYDAAFDFAGYWLKGDAVKVIYTDPYNGEANVSVASPITVKFSGSVPESEISKITVKNSKGVTVTGTWKSLYDNTSWIFTPDVLDGSSLYTITVSGKLKGENGLEMGSDYTANIYTAYDINNKSEGTVTTNKGTYFYLTAPESLGNANKLNIRFRVTNDAANIAKIYAVSNFDVNSPDSSTLGELIGEVNLRGSGYYELDATDYLLKNLGEQVAFVLIKAKEAGTTNVYKSDFSANVNALTVGEMTKISHDTTSLEVPVAKIIRTNSGTKYNQHVIYNSSRITAFSVNNILGFKISEADYGRKFTFKVKVYDTTSRNIQLRLNGNTNSSYETVDYTNPMYNFITKANEWATYTFDYAVYDTDFGKVGFKNKNLIGQVYHTGKSEKPLYIGEITVDETVTDITADNFSCALVNDGGLSYKENESDKPFALFNSEGTKLSEYNTWKDALASYTYGNTLKLMKNYTLTDSDLWSDFSTLQGANGTNGHIFNIDLNGYTINSENTKNSLFWLKNTSLNYEKTVVNVSNGGINLKVTPLVSYESSTSAGSGKNFELNFNKVNIGILDNAYMDSIISANTIATGVNTNVDFNINNCEINLPKAKLTPEYKTIFPAGGTNLDIFYNITGGTVNISSQRWIKLQDKREVATYYKGENGKYMTLSMSSSAVVTSQAYMLDTEEASAFSLVKTENNISTYELSESELSTRYGVIPPEYASVEDHPFVWFDESGIFKGSSTQLYGKDSSASAVGLAKTYLSGNKYNSSTNGYGENPLKAFIVVRKDYTMASDEVYGNSAQIQGTLTIDLNGHIITQNTKPLVSSESKRWSGSGDSDIFLTEILWKNGTIVLSNNSLVHFTAWDSDGSASQKNKDFIHSFSDITFKLKEGATLQNFFTIGAKSSTPTAEGKGTINITDCTFDFETVKPAKPLTLFNANGQYIKLNYNFEGSKILADTMANITLASDISEGSKIVANKNSEGNYLKVYVTSGNKATFKGGKMTVNGVDASFIESEPYGNYAVYTLEEPTVPVIKKVTVTKYVNVGTTDAQSYELQTLDVTNVVTDGVVSSNNSQIDYKGKSTVNMWDTLDPTVNENQHWLIEFDKVHTLGSMEFVYSGTHRWIRFSAQISEDNITWTDLNLDKIEGTAAQNTPVTISLGSKKGKYVKLSVIERQSTNNNTNTIWGPNATGGGCSVALYEILSVTNEDKVDNSVETKYGKIPAEFASVDDYPWVWFDEEGNFKGAYSELYGSTNNTFELSVIGQVKTYLKDNIFDTSTKSYGTNEKKAFILLRKDYSLGSNERYGNMSQIQGTVTIDLNGFTIKTHKNWQLAYSQIKPWSGSGDQSLFPTELKFINGSVVLNAKGLGNFETWTSSTDTTTDLTQKTFTHTYENVTFTLASGVSLSSLFTVTDKTHDSNGYVNFTDCKFDFETVSPTSAITLFNASGSKLKMNYNIKGSEIYASTMANITLSNVVAGSSVTIGKNEDEEYLKVYVDSANKDSFTNVKVNTPDGELAFAEDGLSGKYTVFTVGTAGETPEIPDEPDEPIKTKYGTIPVEYIDADKYPIVWFDELGNFKGASSELFGVSNSTTSPVHLAKTYLKGNVYDTATDSYGANEKKAYILLRKDYKMASNEAYGSLTQAQGVLTIDLNGFTLIQNSKPVATGKAIRWSTSGDAAVFPTEIVFENGTILLKDNGLVAFSVWYASNNDDVKNKKFAFTYNDVTLKLAEGATAKQLFSFAQDGNTPTASSTMTVNMNNCKFDLESVKPQNGFTLFNANGDYVKVNYNIKGSEVYANSMTDITVASAVNEGSSVVSTKNADNNYLKVFVTKENKDSFVGVKMNNDEGEAEFREISVDDKYAVFTLEKVEEVFDPSSVLSYHNSIFASKDTITLKDGTTYTGLVGVVFAKAIETSGDYRRVEYGVAISEKELSKEEFDKDSSVIFAKGEKINLSFQYGIRFYGSKIKEGNTYYTLPYAIYENKEGEKVTVFGNSVITFTPSK